MTTTDGNHHQTTDGNHRSSRLVSFIFSISFRFSIWKVVLHCRICLVVCFRLDKLYIAETRALVEDGHGVVVFTETTQPNFLRKVYLRKFMENDFPEKYGKEMSVNKWTKGFRNFMECIIP